MSIRLDHIALSYGSRTLLDNVSATFEQGQLTALIGRNGTGKSTLLRAMAGLGAASAGNIELCGRPLAALTPHERATTVGFVTTDRVRIANLACEDVWAALLTPTGSDACRRPTAPSSNARWSWWACRVSPARRWTACPTANASG